MLKSVSALNNMLTKIESGSCDVDIAELNLMCASGLPGSNDQDVDRGLCLIDEMAQHVHREIERNYHYFLREPEKYEASQARFCVLMMITVLQQDFGVQYNPARIRDPDFKNSSDLFVHGMLGGEGGTCASMPVLYTIIARRLGWPVKLVSAKSHLLARWDDSVGTHPFGSDRFNIEGSGLGGKCVDDSYYHQWPVPMTPDEIERGIYLRSLCPVEEIAVFLTLRGHCLLDNGRLAGARDAYRWASRLDPRDPFNKLFFEDAVRRIDRWTEETTLRDYLGPNVPVPLGVFPPTFIRQLSVEMQMARHAWHEAASRQQRLALEERRERERLASMPRRIGPLGITYRMERQLDGHTVAIPETRIPGQPWNPPALGNVPFRADSSLGLSMANVGGVIPIGAQGAGLPALPLFNPLGRSWTDCLPADLLSQVAPTQLAMRRQQAVEAAKTLPPMIAASQIRRVELKPPVVGRIE